MRGRPVSEPTARDVLEGAPPKKRCVDATSRGSTVGKTQRATTRNQSRRCRSPGSAARKPASGAIRYRDDAGPAWSGRGRRPGWINAALAAGKTLDDFAVNKG